MRVDDEETIAGLKAWVDAVSADIQEPSHFLSKLLEPVKPGTIMTEPEFQEMRYSKEQ